jgi:hypothetical protein
VTAVHDVKSWPEFFSPIIAGVRSHELRVNDRNYAVDDLLRLHEWDPKIEDYTGRTAVVRITSITSHAIPCAASALALADDHCILSIRMVELRSTS